MLRNFARTVVHACRRAPWTVIALTLAAAGLCAFAASRDLSINTDLDALFNRNLPFRYAEKAFDQQFPREVDLIVAVVDGPSAIAAGQAAVKLAAKLAPRSDLFNFVSTPGGGPFFDKNGLLYLSTDELNELATKLAAAQPLLGSIAGDRNARGLFRLLDMGFDAAARGEPGAEEIAPAAVQAADVIAATLHGYPKTMDWQSLFSGLAPPGQSPRALMLAQPKLDTSALEQAGPATALIRETARELGLTPENGFRVRLTGQVPLADEEFATVAKGTGIAGIISVVLVGVLLLLALGSVRVVIAALLTLAAGLVLTIGWATFTVHELNLISVAFAVMFVGIAVDFAIQFCMSYRAERRARGDDPDGLGAALDAAGAGTARPLLLAATATALGFFSFLPTQYRGVAQLGVIAGGGMIVALILTFTLLPALLRIMRPKPEREGVGYAWAEPFNRLILARRRPVLIASIGLAALSLAALPRLVFDFDPLKLKDPSTESMSTAFELMDDPLVNPNTLDALVPTADEAKALAAKLSALPEVRQALTVLDLIPEDQEAKLAIIDDLGGLMTPVFQPELTGETKPPPTPKDIVAAADGAARSAQAYLKSANASGPLREAAARLAPLLARVAQADDTTLETLSASLLQGFDDALAPLKTALTAEPVTIDALPADLRETYIARDGRYRVQIFPAGNGADSKSLTQFLMAVRSIVPDAIGSPVVIYETGRIVTRAFAIAAALALFSITALLFAVMRRPIDVGRVLAPLLFAALLTFGTCAITGFALNFANIIALPLLLGVGVTFPIYFVSAWRDGVELLLPSPAGRGMFFSALTTASAFGSLAVSKHSGTAAMGLLLTMALGYTLLATLVLLPALLGPQKGPRP